MTKQDFWSGFGIGSLTGLALGAAAFSTLDSSSSTRVYRLERSIQIARPNHHIFHILRDFERLPTVMRQLRSFSHSGDAAHLTMHHHGRPLSLSVSITQIIPDEAIAWKSISGPHHDGRIHFAKLGDQSLVHVLMNYDRASSPFSRLLAPSFTQLDDLLASLLRDLKSALESDPSTNADRQPPMSNLRRAQTHEESMPQSNPPKHGPQSAGWDEAPPIDAQRHENEIPQQATGATAPATNARTSTGAAQTSSGATASAPTAERAGSEHNNPVDYTRPPEDRYPFHKDV